MSDFINYYRKLSKQKKEQDAEASKKEAPAPPPVKKEKPPKPKKLTAAEKQIMRAESLLSHYRGSYSETDPQVLENMSEIKDIVNQPKESSLDERYEQINARLGEAECHETLREERWPENIACPYCESDKIKRLPETEQKTPNNYRYQCLDCDSRFNDDSETPLEWGTPNIHTWMQCWYLVGCTTSIQYISTKLGLDIVLVERMIAQLQKLFKAEQPLTRYLNFDDWSKQHAELYEKKIQENILDKQELHMGETKRAPKDTAELRRQKERRRNPTPPKNRGG